eukprot:scaffold4851_cov79-Cyclotella_meneghiniana.AAC.2
MSSSSTKWPSHIEHYNLELAMQTDFDSIEFEDDSIDDRSKTSSIQPEQFVATKKRDFRESTTTATTTTAIEHFNPIDPSKPSANEAAPITTLKQETKRRKSNCSNKPQKIHNANTKHGGNKTNRKIREVQDTSFTSYIRLIKTIDDASALDDIKRIPANSSRYLALSEQSNILSIPLSSRFIRFDSRGLRPLNDTMR